jgi:hypothetical protein
MDAENFVVDNSCHWKAIKALNKLFPKLKAVSTLAFVIKPINPINRPTLMISSQQEKVFGIFDFVGHHKTNDL